MLGMTKYDSECQKASDRIYSVFNWNPPSDTAFCFDIGGGTHAPGRKATHYAPGVHHNSREPISYPWKMLQACVNVPDQPLTVGNIWVGSVWYDWNHSKESIALTISLWMIVTAISVEWYWRYADWRTGRKLLLIRFSLTRLTVNLWTRLEIKFTFEMAERT